MSHAQGEGSSEFVFFDVTGDMGAFLVSRYFPQGAHPFEQESGILYLTVPDLIERYSLRLDELESGTWMGGIIDFKIVGWMVRPLALRSVDYLFRQKLLDAMLLNVEKASKEFRYKGYADSGEVRPLTLGEQEEFFRLAAAWTREAAVCGSHIAAGTEAGEPVYLGQGDCEYLQQWTELLLQAQGEPADTVETAVSLLQGLADRMEQQADEIAQASQEL